jgi:hypothetical protein
MGRETRVQAVVRLDSEWLLPFDEPSCSFVE